MFTGGKADRCVGLIVSSPSCADCHEIWEPQTFGTLRDCPGIALSNMNIHTFRCINSNAFDYSVWSQTSRNLWYMYRITSELWYVVQPSKPYIFSPIEFMNLF